jgi:hypothetical protein
MNNEKPPGGVPSGPRCINWLDQRQFSFRHAGKFKHQEAAARNIPFEIAAAEFFACDVPH